MARSLRIAVCFSAALFFVAHAALAQAPKVGDYYEDTTQLGFRVKTPKGWEFVPPQPDEVNLIGKYDPKTNPYIQLGSGGDSALWLHVWLVKFDNRPQKEEAGDGDVIRFRGKPATNVEEWLKQSLRGKLKKDKEKKKKFKKTQATEFEFVGKLAGEEFRVFAMQYELEPDLKVAIIGNGPGDKKKWKKYYSAFASMAKGFKRLEVEAVEVTGGIGSGSLRSQKRAALQDEVSRTPGWELYETENYFVISNNDDREFIKELQTRLEAIREQYEIYYPAEQAARLRQKAAEEKKKREEEGEGDEDGDPSIEDIMKRRSSAAKADPLELSKCSVVRVCKTKSQYHSYGGPGGSAGYWSWVDEELVIYDDKMGGGRRDTWATLNHEAFHQYIFYFYGSLSPHSWYNEGTGDFYSGFQLKNSRFKLKPFDWRKGLIQENIKADNYAPLKDITRWTQGQYYGGNDLGLSGGDNYAQGWSFIYFMRLGPKQSRMWNDDWNGILDTYLETLAFTEDLDQAVDTAFAGVDWDELEEAWKKFTLGV